jgi:hypothetical protein
VFVPVFIDEIEIPIKKSLICFLFSDKNLAFVPEQSKSLGLQPLHAMARCARFRQTLHKR